MVAGSELYKIKIAIAPVTRARWKSICRDCAGTVDSLVELLQGRLAKAMDRFESRLPRGRSYVRNGSVVDLKIATGEVAAMVSGSELYQIKITISPVAEKRWRAICRDCAGTIDSLVELLQGRLAKGVMDRVCREGDGLFPSPSEIKLSCSCPDWADMCKHVAAALYGVGARLDEKPQLLFVLRGVDESELLARSRTGSPADKSSAQRGEGARRQRCRGPVRAGDGRNRQFRYSHPNRPEAEGKQNACREEDCGGKDKQPTSRDADQVRA